ncbi:siroheme synthase CysG [Lysobacter sp. CFH 32150]|uniref:siroheme synthase CysG n=1 Tax=Lysobacter sp. CFH 32150 TaxID=2927128 RepID=UPI001FA6FC8C|nr:siroheme synthase CysG [Lysobacter sp. CFH 32150]MCI4567024.1 siroheme synthase CysG [Lysobacter sp. CFH 32150]
MNLFPLFVDLRSRPVLLVGGGTVAERKARLLLEAGAHLSVGAPTLTPTLEGWRDAGRIVHLPGDFQAHWLQGQRLVIAATDDIAVNQEVAAAAETHNVFVNVVDDAELSSFQVPAIVDRSPLVIAISSGGAAPMLARKVRERLEATLEHSLGPLARLLEGFRGRIRARFPDLAQRRRFYDELWRGEVARLVEQAQPEDASQALSAALEQPDGATAGSVTLVGAGPGNPELLTLAALRALSTADVILFDRLVQADILAMARRDAVFIDVGKEGGGTHVPQERTHELLLEYARTGAHVVRLKGGDPFVFGRGGEEIEFLHAHGVPYRVIPGITAALACAAYTGVPLTHRNHAQSLRLLTAHCNTDFGDEDWAALAVGRQTLAVYMGVRALPVLREKLLTHGAQPDTPFVLVENASLPQQRTVCGTLAELVELATQHAVQSPALLILGPTAQYAQQLHWYGAPPLTNA